MREHAKLSAVAAAAASSSSNGSNSHHPNGLLLTNGNGGVAPSSAGPSPYYLPSSLAPAATISPPSGPTDVLKHARTIQKRPEVNDLTPHIVEEYILETAERGAQRIYHTRLTIFQRLANEEYLGELYVERDYRENENKGSTCR